MGNITQVQFWSWAFLSLLISGVVGYLVGTRQRVREERKYNREERERRKNWATEENVGRRISNALGESLLAQTIPYKCKSLRIYPNGGFKVMVLDKYEIPLLSIIADCSRPFPIRVEPGFSGFPDTYSLELVDVAIEDIKRRLLWTHSH